ncbi:hypothetical protein SK128_018742, partial [Halocaridina rubra]
FNAGLGKGKTQRPMVAGTSSVTIFVGSTLRPTSLSLSKESPISKPISPPQPVRIMSPNPSSFPHRGFLSSIYNPRPFNNQGYSNMLADFDPEVESASKNIVKGPRDSMGKVGSIKFAKKPRCTQALAGVEVVDSKNESAASSFKIYSSSPNATSIKPELVSRKPTVPPPVPKPRTHLPNTNSKTVEDVEKVKRSDRPFPSRAELTLDLKPVYEVDIEKACDIGIYQPMPDVVSMTQKHMSPVGNIEGEVIHKSMFRINKENGSTPVSPNELAKDTMKEAGPVHISDNCFISKKTPISDISDQQKSRLTGDTYILSVSQKCITKPVLKNASLNAPSRSSPKSRSKKNVKTHCSQHIMNENNLHAELKDKFTYSNASENLSRLRKVKTREPKSVKELFPDYTYGQSENAKNDVRRKKGDAVEKNISPSYKPESVAKDLLSLEKSTKLSNVSPKLKARSALSPSLAPDSPPNNGSLTLLKHEEGPVISPRKNRNKKKDLINNKSKSPDPASASSHGRHLGPGLVSYHDSLRVPWKGPEENNFSR